MDIHILLSLFHIFFVVPVLLYVALSKANTTPTMYQIFLFLGVVVFLYQGYKVFDRLNTGSPYVWVNLIHVLFVAPLMIYIGYTGKDTPRVAYELLALITFAALGYHTYSLILLLNVNHQER